MMNGMAAFFSSILDSLQEQIAVIDNADKIVYVNRSWLDFSACNGLIQTRGSDPVGTDYLVYCGEQQRYIKNGFQNVFDGKLDAFYHEYLCPTSADDKPRWYMLRASLLTWREERYIVISHHDITTRKLIEEEVKRTSLQDPLTNLANRRHFNQFWHHEWRRSMRYGNSISLIMIDIDHFKTYNDTQGHLEGDKCLQRVGAVLGELANRPNDMAARYGGEEFVFVLGDSNLSDAVNFAENIRAKISDLNINYGSNGHITASFGVASTVPERHQPEWWLINKADQALYLAKNNGRNRVESIDPTQMQMSEHDMAITVTE